MIVRVLNKEHFELILPRMRIYNSNVEEQMDKAFISITDGYNTDIHYFNKDYKNVLNLEFDDVTDRNSDGNILFNREHGSKIIEFVERNNHVETLYVHCLAGVSRSGAVGVFLNEIYGSETFYDFCNSNTKINPNFFILALLRRMYNNIPDES